MGHSIRSILYAAGALALIPALALAQGPPSSELSKRLRPGDTVWITEAGPPVKGKLIDVSDTTLRMYAERAALEIDTARITRIDRAVPSKTRGAVIGGLTGGVLLGLFAVAFVQLDCERWPDSTCGDFGPMAGTFAIGGAYGGAIGAGAGALIGHFIKHRETVFKPSTIPPARSPSRSP